MLILKFPVVVVVVVYVAIGLVNRDKYKDGWLGSRVVSVLDSGAEGPGFKSQSQHGRS